MRRSDDIPVWENVRRRDLLFKLREDVIEYFNDVEGEPFESDLREGEKARRARHRINLVLEQASAILAATGVSTTVVQYPPAGGGQVKEIDVVHNLFRIHQALMSPRTALDAIERAIGVLEHDYGASVRRTLSPLYWLRRLLEYVLSLPFRILNAAGFNAERLEHSWFGRTFRLLGYLAALIASVATVLEFLGWRKTVAEWVHRVLAR